MTRSLRMTILGFVAIGLVLPAVLSLAVLTSRVSEETSLRIRFQLDQYADILAFGAREPLWNLNPESMQAQVEAVLKNPDVVFISVTDRATGPLITVDRTPKGVKVLRDTRKVRYKNRELGTVTVGVTGESLMAQNRQNIAGLTTTMLLQLTLATVLIFVLLRRQLVAPLEVLGKAADALAQGDLTHAVPKLGDNEIGRLGLRFESTRRELLDLFASLEDKNTALVHQLTERTRADQARRESEELFKAVFALSAEPMIVRRSRDNSRLLSNPAWEAAFGAIPDDAQGEQDHYAQLWVDEENLRTCGERLNHDGRLDQQEVRLHRRDGSIALMLASARRFENRGEDCALWSLHDITAARAAENTLRESEQQFAALFQHAPVPLCIVDVEDEARIVDVNAPFESDFGIPRGTCLGQTLASLGLWPEAEDGEHFARLLGGENGGKIEVWMPDAQRKPSCRDISGSHMQLHGRHHFVWSAIDVTPIIRAKQQVDGLNRNLEEKVARRTRALEESNQELAATIERLRQAQAQLVQSEKLAALGALVAGIAHELNTPIGNCMMVASTLEDARDEFTKKLEGGLRRSTLEEFLSSSRDGNETLIRNLRRAADLVTSFKQVAVDQTSSQRRSFDLHEIIREIEITLAPTLRKSHTRIHNEVAEGITFDSYPGPLGQIITNLANNAVTHGFEDRAEGGDITIYSEILTDGQVQLCVEDNGRGIPTEIQPRIFDPFFTTRLGSGGCGLGLHIVYNIVTSILGGQINVSSQIGKGSRFTLTLPRNAPQRGGIAQ